MENVMERQKKESRVAVQLRDTLEVSKFFQVTSANKTIAEFGLVIRL
jgi:hypothetical protein